jgi:hypothetical protein
MKTNELFEIVEDRGCSIQYVRFSGTWEECQKWLEENTILSEIGTHIPVEVDDFNKNWDYSIKDTEGYFYR